ncbi:MAG: outer membrane beta-barrel protein [Pseudomonadota bacterium]
MTLRTIAAVIAASAVCATAHAEVDFNYLEAGYVNTDIDTGFGDEDGDGFSLAASFDISDDFFFFGEYSNSDIGPVDFSTLALGAGFHTPLNGPAELVARGGFARGEADAGPFGDASENGFLLSVGARGEFSPQLEWDLFLNYVDLDDSDTSVKGALRYEFTPTLAVGASLESGDDVDVFGIQVRWLYQ